jgi:hypothetical protein
MFLAEPGVGNAGVLGGGQVVQAGVVVGLPRPRAVAQALTADVVCTGRQATVRRRASRGLT